MLKSRLIHPALLAALAPAGHGARVLVADGNYPYSTCCAPNAPLVQLNLAPGLLTVEQVLEVLLTAVPVEAAATMVPGAGQSEPAIHTRFRELLPSDVKLDGLSRGEFYTSASADDVVVSVATGEQRTYANLLLTIGVVG